jgi:hypothetical protein
LRSWQPIVSALTVALVSLAPAQAYSEESMPPRLSLQVMLKVLTYDRNFLMRGTGDFVVLVVNEPTQALTREEVLEAIRELAGSTLHKRPIRIVAAEFKAAPTLREAAKRSRASAILVLPGLSAGGLEIVTQVAREARLYSLSLDPEKVEHGLALGVTAENGRPKILLNLITAKEINASFESSVLLLARTYPREPASAPDNSEPSPFLDRPAGAPLPSPPH